MKEGRKKNVIGISKTSGNFTFSCLFSCDCGIVCSFPFLVAANAVSVVVAVVVFTYSLPSDARHNQYKSWLMLFIMIMMMMAISAFRFVHRSQIYHWMCKSQMNQPRAKYTNTHTHTSCAFHMFHTTHKHCLGTPLFPSKPLQCQTRQINSS